MSPAELIYGRDLILPIELEVPTWRTLPWEATRSTADLLAMRARQIERRDRDMEEAALRLRRLRERNKELFDERHDTRDKQIEPGTLVLVHNTKLDTDRSAKLAFRWKGPYRVREAFPNGSYQLEELDGAAFRGRIHASRVKVYYQRDETEPLTAEDLNMLGFSEEDLEAENQFGIMPTISDEDSSTERMHGEADFVPGNTAAEITINNHHGPERLDFPTEADFGVFIPPYSEVESFDEL